MWGKRSRAAKQWRGFELDPELDEDEGASQPGSSVAQQQRVAGGAATAAAAAGQDSEFQPGEEEGHEDSDVSDGGDDEQEEEQDFGEDSEAEAPPRKKAARGSSSKKSSSNKQKSSGRRIGAKKAKKIYCLGDSDLANMKDVKVNHSFFGSHTMYSMKELEEYARAKHGNSEWFERNLRSHQSWQAHKTQCRRGIRATVTAAALQRVNQYAAPKTAIEVEQYGDTKLPDNVLLKVMECLARTREPGGLRGFACVANDLANASLANWDFYRAAKAGFQVLADDAKTTQHPPVGRGPPYRYTPYASFLYGGDLQDLPGPGGWAFWEGFLQDPLRPKAKELQEAMRAVRLTPKGTKAEMALRILGEFGLKAATSMPVQLLRLVRLERARRLAWDGPEGYVLHDRVNTAIDRMIKADEEGWKHLKTTRDGSGRGVAYIRKTIRQRYSSIDEFVQAAEAADQEQQRKEEADRAAAAAAAAAAGLPPPAAPAPPAPTPASHGMLLSALLMDMFTAEYGYGDEYDF